MTEHKPRPCPFCGGDAVVATSIGGNCYIVKCHGFGCHVAPCTDAFDTAERAVACWNGLERKDARRAFIPYEKNDK